MNTSNNKILNIYQNINYSISDSKLEMTNTVNDIIANIVNDVFNKCEINSEDEVKTNKLTSIINVSNQPIFMENPLPSLFNNLNSICLAQEEFDSLLIKNSEMLEFSDGDVIQRLNLNMPLRYLQKSKEHYLRKANDRTLFRAEKELIDFMKKNGVWINILDLRGLNVPDPLEFLQYCPNLHTLAVSDPRSLVGWNGSLSSYPSRVFHEILNTFAATKLSHLRVLHLSNFYLSECPIPTFLTSILKLYPLLQTLYLPSNGIKDSDLVGYEEVLGELAQLKVLDLGSNSLSDHSIPLIERLLKKHCLTDIGIDENKMTTKGRIKISETFARYTDNPTKVLWLNAGNKLASLQMDLMEMLEFLTENGKEITFLNLNDLSTRIKPLQLIRSCPNVTKLSLVGNVIDKATLQSISSITNLEELVLSDSHIDVEEIAANLKPLRCLTKVAFSNLGIDDEIFSMILNALGDKIKLHTFIANDNPISDFVAKELIPFLQEKKHLYLLSLQNNDMTNRMALEIIQACPAIPNISF